MFMLKRFQVIFNSPFHSVSSRLVFPVFFLVLFFFDPTCVQSVKDISQFTSHFRDPDRGHAPWGFYPEDSIASVSTTESPGFVVIRNKGGGTDIKGILAEPIRMDEYPVPWEFHMGFMQDKFQAVGSEGQVNYAFGVNVAVTFSDPSTWPADRTQRPPNTRSVQLLLVHMGNVGENFRAGLPLARLSGLNSYDSSPEVFLVYGRGDLDPIAQGNWNFGYTSVGADLNNAGSGEAGGAADPIIKFRVGMNSSNLTLGVGFGPNIGWKSRVINFGRFGKATGIWEIGPIISLDNWMAEELGPELGLTEPPRWLKSIKSRYSTSWGEHDPATIDPLLELFRIQPPDPKVPCYLDYAIFYHNGPGYIEQLGEEFNVPGFLAGEKYYIEGNVFTETFSNPGFLTATSFGNHGGWAMCPIFGGSSIDLTGERSPPFEVEIAAITPDNDKPWNLWWNIGIWNEKGDKYAGWQPCIKNIPGVGRRFTNSFSIDPDAFEYPTEIQNSAINPRFDPPIPELLGHKPLYWLLQVKDEYHVRVGVRGDSDDPWTFSTECDTRDIFGSDGPISIVNKNSSGPVHHTGYKEDDPFGKIGKFGYPALVSYQLQPKDGVAGVGNAPGYQQMLIDYIRYRYECSE